MFVIHTVLTQRSLDDIKKIVSPQLPVAFPIKRHKENVFISSHRVSNMSHSFLSFYIVATIENANKDGVGLWTVRYRIVPHFLVLLCWSFFLFALLYALLGCFFCNASIMFLCVGIGMNVLFAINIFWQANEIRHRFESNLR